MFQLQRIVSRCKCEFFYAGYGESSVDPSILNEVPPPPAEENGTPWEQQDKAVDAFTLMHHDLDVCTNSLQVRTVQFSKKRCKMLYSLRFWILNFWFMISNQ